MNHEWERTSELTFDYGKHGFTYVECKVCGKVDKTDHDTGKWPSREGCPGKAPNTDRGQHAST